MPIAVGTAVPRGLVQHVFSPPARMKLSRLTAPPWPRRRAKNALHYAECSIMPSTRLYRVGSLKESNSLARVTRHNHRVARNAMSLSVGL